MGVPIGQAQNNQPAYIVNRVVNARVFRLVSHCETYLHVVPSVFKLNPRCTNVVRLIYNRGTI